MYRSPVHPSGMPSALQTRHPPPSRPRQPVQQSCVLSQWIPVSQSRQQQATGVGKQQSSLHSDIFQCGRLNCEARRQSTLAISTLHSSDLLTISHVSDPVLSAGTATVNNSLRSFSQGAGTFTERGRRQTYISVPGDAKSSEGK